MIDTVTKIYDFNNNFCSYDVTYTHTNVTKSVPLDTANKDYQAIQDWIADGNSVVDPNAE